MTLKIKEAMQFINSFGKSGKRVEDLSRFQYLMDRLGNPQDSLRFVHVAGTNGKGSTVRMIARALIQTGYRTGEFTSPFMLCYNDRIRVNGENISDEEIAEIVPEIMNAVRYREDAGYSQFEITTALAFIWFKRIGCDVVVLETGVGGLLDCTNIIKAPYATVITSISYDHTALLGNTIYEIATQKAGIIKQGSTVIMAPENPPEAQSVIRHKAALCGDRLIVPDLDRVTVENCDFSGNTFRYKGTLYRTKMMGAHQIINAVTAIETLNVLREQGFSLSDLNIYDGVRLAEVTARCQLIGTKPLILVDGAHNPAGMRAFADIVKGIPNYPKVLVIGMLEEKDFEKTIREIAPYADGAVCVDGFHPKSVFSGKLQSMFNVSYYETVENSLKKAVGMAGENGLVMVCGSLYLAAEVLKRCRLD